MAIDKKEKELWDALRAEKYDNHFSSVAAWLHRKNDLRLSWTSWAHKRMRLGLAVFTFVLLCLSIPTPRSEAVGYVGVWTLHSKNPKACKEVRDLPWVNNEQIHIKHTIDGSWHDFVIYWVHPALNAGELTERNRDLKKVPDIVSIKMEPLVIEKSVSLWDKIKGEENAGVRIAQSFQSVLEKEGLSQPQIRFVERVDGEVGVGVRFQ